MRSVPKLMSKACDEINQLRAERDALNARISAMEESTHYASGCADLAMKHRDIAEAELAALRARIDDAATVTMIGISPTAGYLGYTNPSGGFFESSFEDCPECPILGKRIALVPLDD